MIQMKEELEKQAKDYEDKAAQKHKVVKLHLEQPQQAKLELPHALR